MDDRGDLRTAMYGRQRIPRLVTERLELRGHVEADLGDCALMWGDPAVTRFIGGSPASREEVWSRILRYRGLWAILGFGYWVVRKRHGGAFVGEVGFGDFHRDIQLDQEHTRDGLGSRFGRSVPRLCDRGVEAALSWLSVSSAAREAVCIISLGNAPSLKVAARTGFRAMAETTYKGARTMILRRGLAGEPG